MKYRFRRRILYVLLLLGYKIILFLPTAITLVMGKYLGRLAYVLLPKYSRMSRENLEIAFGKEKTSEEIKEIARSVFENLGINAAEFLSLTKIKKQLIKNMQFVGSEKLDKALNKGKGIILLAPHLGNWEILPLFFTARGYHLNAIARRVYYEKYDEFVNSLRAITGIKLIFRDESPIKILKTLKRNEILGIMADQDIDSVENVFVRFFDKPTCTPIAPVKLAIKTGAAILLCFVVRENKWHHKVIIEDPIDLKITDDEQSDILVNTQAWTNAIESYIRKYPDQWVWVHNRWKTKPK